MPESVSGVFNVKSYGAIGDGKADDTMAIQRAIRAVGGNPLSHGGVVYLPRGRYKITSGLTIGDGSFLRPATKEYIHLTGDGDGPTDVELMPPNGPVGATVIQWAGPANGTMVTVNGPIGGIKMEGIQFEAKAGPNAAATALRLNHVMNSDFRDLTMMHTQAAALIVTSYPSTTAAADGGNDNLFENIRIQSLAPGGKALQLGPELMNGGILDVARNTFINCNLMGDIELRATDASTFINVQGGTLKVFPPKDYLSLPGGISFYNCPLAVDTTTGRNWNGSQPLTFFPHPTGDITGAPLAVWARGVTTDGVWFERGAQRLGSQGSADGTIELLRLHNASNGTSAAARLSFMTGTVPTESGSIVSGYDQAEGFYTAFGNTSGEVFRILGTKVGIGTTAPTSKLQVVGLPVYRNNAAAKAGGLTVGAFYRTGGDPDLVAVVH
jgi:hypothetical protein